MKLLFCVLSTLIPCAAQSITLKHTSCFGTCPVYSLRIESSGTVLYEGQENVATKGKQTSSITRAQFQELVNAFVKIGFFHLRDAYRMGPTDKPTVYIGLVQGGKSKTVEDYYNAPPALRDLERQIERTVNVHRWLHDKKKQVTINAPLTGFSTKNIDDLKSDAAVEAGCLLRHQTWNGSAYGGCLFPRYRGPAPNPTFDEEPRRRRRNRLDRSDDCRGLR